MDLNKKQNLDKNQSGSQTDLRRLTNLAPNAIMKENKLVKLIVCTYITIKAMGNLRKTDVAECNAIFTKKNLDLNQSF